MPTELLKSIQSRHSNGNIQKRITDHILCRELRQRQRAEQMERIRGKWISIRRSKRTTRGFF